MKIFLWPFIAICITTVLLSSVHAEEGVNDSDKNLKYLIDSLDLENKKFSPEDPENEFQEVMRNYMNDIMAQNIATQKTLTLIGPIEFEAMSDLSFAKNIQVFRENITQYKKVKKSHYDTLNNLMREANTKIGKDELAKKRLGGSGAFYEEKLELLYLYDLDKYYEFLLKNHDKFRFQGEDIYGTDGVTLKKYNALREEMVESANNINKTQELKNNLLRDRMEELKD